MIRPTPKMFAGSPVFCRSGWNNRTTFPPCTGRARTTPIGSPESSCIPGFRRSATQTSHRRTSDGEPRARDEEIERAAIGGPHVSGVLESGEELILALLHLLGRRISYMLGQGPDMAEGIFQFADPIPPEHVLRRQTRLCAGIHRSLPGSVHV